MDKVRIVEVGPRDGLQNIGETLPLKLKLDFIEKLSKAGLKDLEVGAFVSPKWVPQMADTEAIIRSLPTTPGVNYWALVPNAKGLDSYLKTSLNHLAFFTAASDQFNIKNTNKSFEQSIEHLSPLLEKCKGHTVRIYLSTVWHCPYSGDIDLNDIEKVFSSLAKLGFDDLSLGDTTGMATPGRVREVLKVAGNYFSLDSISCHFHDTYSMAMANVFEALEMGVRSFDSSSGGLGGCPYAPGASGNLATEDLVFACMREGLQTGVDLEALIFASESLFQHLKRVSPSKVHQANRPQ